VPAHHYGYLQAKVEYHEFHLYEIQELGNCSTKTLNDYGYMNAIVTYPFFSSCTSTAACTPNP
jgi:hypothetical protein